MPSSILHTAELPAFDQWTGQLSLASHDLVSAPLSLSNAFPPEYTLLFDEPPSRPYGTASRIPEAEQAAGQSRRKRRRLGRPDETASPIDWIRHREKEETRTSTDRESDEHHVAIEAELSAGMEAVRAGWNGEHGCMGAGRERYRWRTKDDGDTREEIDLVALGEQSAPTSDEPRDQLRLDKPHSTVSTAALFGRIVGNHSLRCITLDIAYAHAGGTATPAPKATAILPPSSGFLLQHLSAWPSSASQIASLGREKDGWDVLIVEFVPTSLAIPLSPR